MGPNGPWAREAAGPTLQEHNSRFAQGMAAPMLDVRRLPHFVVTATFALSGVVATTGLASIATGASVAAAHCDVDADKPAGDILACVGPSTAYVQTPIGAGSGLVLPGGYVLTNAHVVDPFAKVDVTIGEQELTDVPVVGVDLRRDIAVLGPVETDAPPVHLIDPSDLAKGDELFLVGYPGQINEDDLEPTVADGILSRTRHSDLFDLDYLQTDASIGGGQSGGALVDIEGNVVGISSLRFAENFALALSASNAQTAVDEIIAGSGSPYTSWPGGEPSTQATLQLPRDYSPMFVAFPNATEDRTVDIIIPPDQPVILVTGATEDENELETAGNLRAIAAEELDLPLSALDGATQEDLTRFMDEDVSLAQELAPGQFRFKLPANKHVLLVVLTNREGGLQDLPIASSIPMVALAGDARQDLILGQEINGFLGSMLPYDEFTMNLSEGQTIDIYAGSPSGDVAVSIIGPNGNADDSEDWDDSGSGLYGVDVEESFTAPVAGVYTIEVSETDGSSTAYYLKVSEG